MFRQLRFSFFGLVIATVVPTCAIADTSNKTKSPSFSCSHNGSYSGLNNLTKNGYLLPKLQYPTTWDFSATKRLWPPSAAEAIENIIAYHIVIFGAEDKASKLLLSGFPIKPLSKDISFKGGFLSKANNEIVEGLFTISPEHGPEIFLSEAILKDSFIAITKLRHELWHYLEDKQHTSDSSHSWYQSELREAKREVESILTLRRFYLDYFGVTDHSKHALDLLDFHLLGAMLRQSNYQLHLDATDLVLELNNTDSSDFAGSDFARSDFTAAKDFFNGFLKKDRLTPSPEEHVAFKENALSLSLILKNQSTGNSLSKLSVAANTAIANSDQAIRRLVSFHNNVRYWQVQ